MNDRGYRGGVPTAVQARRPCPLCLRGGRVTHFSDVRLGTRGFCVFVFSCVVDKLDIVDRVTFCVFGVFSLVCFELSVPVQVIAWKDFSPK